MVKNFLIIVFICFVIITNLPGCIQQNESSLPAKTIQGPLNLLALTVDDVNESYDIIDEDHVTEPYTAEEGLLFEGWYVKEKYQVTLLFNKSTFIQHLIARLNSSEYTADFIQKIRNDINTLGYKFKEMACETIGEETFLGSAEINLVGKKITSYFLSFRIADVIVVLQTSGIDQEMVQLYAKIVEERIEANSIINII